ncbi:MAG: hypothetical protein ACLP5H_11275 [Desulfomonilaceae bacterium]
MEENTRTDELEMQPDVAVSESTKIEFTCPECGYDMLLHIVQVAQVVKFSQYGLFVHDQWPYDEQGYYRCGNCEYELEDESGGRIFRHADVIRWLFRRQAEEVIEELALEPRPRGGAIDADSVSAKN